MPPTPHPPASSNQQTRWVMIGLILGIAVGGILNHFLSGSPTHLLPDLISLFSAVIDIFMRLIKMLIAPLVFSTLVVGIANMGGDGNILGRVGGKAILWFFSASILSLLLGMLLVNLWAPGESLHLQLPAVGAETGIMKAPLTLSGFISHIVPTSVVAAMAENEILQIVVFALFFGVACAQLGAAAKPIVLIMDSMSHVILRMTGYVMRMASFAVFSAITAVIANQGIGAMATYGVFLAEFYLSLFLLWCVLSLIGYLFLGPAIASLIRHIKEPMLLAFGTASSEAAYPMLLRQLERFGCEDRIAGLVLPLGYSFNLDGSMMYMTFAVLFIAQAYGIHMPLPDQILMLFVLLFTSKGVAGVPRASLIVISATLSMFHIPEAGLLLLLGVDQILDMGRSATNVLGNSIAAAVISRWENRTEVVGS